MKRTSLIFYAAVLLAACTDHYLPCRSVQGLWGEEKVSLEISFAETVCSTDSKTGIRFSDVVDSRCPEDLHCIWAGEVRPRLDIVRGETVIGSFDMSPGVPKELEVDQQPFIFTLTNVTPNPPPDEIKKHQYKITLEIEAK